MTPQEFLKALDSELQDRRFADRLKQDLAEHMEDIAAVEHLQGASSDDAILCRIGDTQEISRLYRSAMRHSNPSFLYLESAVFGLLSLPLYLATVFLATMVEVDSLSASELLPIVLGMAFIFLVLLPLYNLFAMRNLVTLHEEATLRKRLLATMLAPALLLPLIVYVAFRSSGAGEFPLHEALRLFIGPAIAICLSVGQYRLLEWLFQPNPQSPVQQRFQRLTAFARRWLGPVVAIVLAAYVTATHVAMTTQAFIVEWHPLAQMLVFGPRFILELLLWMVFAVVSIALENVPGIMFANAQLLTGLFLIAGTAFLSYPLIKWLHYKLQKKAAAFPWLSPAALSYLLFFLFFAPTGAPTVTWNIPALDVSAMIERQQLGPTYRIVKYANQNEGRYSRYWAGELNDGFAFAQTEGPFYFVNLIGDLDKGDLVEDADRLPMTTMPFSPLITTEGVTCDGKPVTTRIRENGDVVFVIGESEDYWQPCNVIHYHDRQLASIEGGSFSGLTVSDDGTFAAMKVSTGAYEPTYVYLIDLRQ